MNYPNLISISIAVLALAISVATYLLSRKMPNENKIFEEKIDAYHAVIKAMNDYVAVLLACINEYLIQKADKHPDLKALAAALNQKIDEAFLDMEDGIAENSLLIPDDIVEDIYEFMDTLSEIDYLNRSLSFTKLDKLEDDINEAFDIVVTAMQQDLGFQKLNKGLKRRTGGQRITFEVIAEN
jgi:hypothetical protein